MYDITFERLKTHVFGGDDLLELGERELLVVLGQVVAEHLLQVLQVLLAQVRPLPEIKRGDGKQLTDIHGNTLYGRIPLFQRIKGE